LRKRIGEPFQHDFLPSFEDGALAHLPAAHGITQFRIEISGALKRELLTALARPASQHTQDDF